MGDQEEELRLRQNMKSAHLRTEGSVKNLKERTDLIKINDNVVVAIYNLIKRAKVESKKSCHNLDRSELSHRLQSLGIYVDSTVNKKELCLRWTIATMIDNNFHRLQDDF